MIKILPSLMAADQLHLGRIIKELEPHCHGFHIDIMDHHFAPNLALSVTTTNSIAQQTHLPLLVHIMAEDPTTFVNELILRAQSTIAVHIETPAFSPSLLESIRHKNLQAGLALKPNTPIKNIEPYLDHLDVILLMGVAPGFSGQPLDETVMEKLELLIAYKKRHSFHIAFDGGITADNIKQLARKGVEFFCIGSAIFDQPSPLSALQELKDLA